MIKLSGLSETYITLASKCVTHKRMMLKRMTLHKIGT
jgi:hypothetical protein